ncbi:YceI family protein [Vibrio sp.]|uniref:YceI family protein n=1 Tax=Vibrio sp. TaxID=678 RepID=UPI003AA86A3C
MKTSVSQFLSKTKVFSKVTGIALGLAFSQQALASWHLDPLHSELHFVTVKNTAVTEVHSFRTIDGMINNQGVVVVDIDLASVNTHIEIRDERMKDMLFNVVNYPEASLSAQVDLQVLNDMKVGEIKTVPLTVDLSLHDHQQKIDTKVLVTALSDGAFQVNTLKPIVVDTALFELTDGVKALQDVAKLDSIATSIPVTAQFVFQPE